MDLLKIFQFKGLYQNGSKANVPLGYFRRFTNSFKQKGGKIKPYCSGTLTSNTVSIPASATTVTWGAPVFSAIFQGGILQLMRGSASGIAKGGLTYLKNGTFTPIAQPYKRDNDSLYDLANHASYLPSGSFCSAVVNNKLFIAEYIDYSEYNSTLPTATKTYSQLLKFDGIQVSGAGLPTPWRHIDANTAGTRQFRIFYTTIGADAELVFSNYQQVKAVVSGVSESLNIYLGGYTDAGATTRRADVVDDATHAAAMVFPKTREASDSLFADRYFNKKWAKPSGDASFSSGVGIQMNCTSAAHDLGVGDWLLVTSVNSVFAVLGAKLYDAFLLQVKSYNGTVIVYERNIKAFNSTTASWEDFNLDNGAPSWYSSMADLLTDIQTGWHTNIILWVYGSGDETGTNPFTLRTMLPIFWDTNDTGETGTNTVYSPLHPIFGVISGTFDDFYETSDVKTTFPPVKGITSYNNLLVGFDDNAIYFSDTSYGGSTEMVSGVSNLLPYGSEFGKITAVCGSEDFLFMSRERRNYVITGELTTGNISIKEVDLPTIGAHNARCVSNAFSGKIIFMNKVGVFAVDASGAVEELSKDIRDLFINSLTDGNLFDKTVFKSSEDKLSSHYDGKIFKIAVDEERGFILFHTGSVNTSGVLVSSNILVLDMNDKTWYEWEGTGQSVEALYGKVFQLGTSYSKEDTTINKDQILTTQWLTGGEPSLEKQVTQVKFYGTVTNGVTVEQQNDWDSYIYGDLVTGEQYLGSGYAHKQRLTSSKAQATCVGFVTDSSAGESIELEGIELEWAIVQQGVKR